ncbi:MAG TPA: RNA methyltransferase [Gemmatimonadaceae bacterium]|nr:RNA methyltransferase [Gemmatimonadaceae bacterium]
MKLLSLARDLRRRKARERQGLFVAEGVRGVEELLASGLDVRGLLTAPTLPHTPRGAALLAAAETRRVPVLAVSDADFASAADTDSPQGVLAVAEVPRFDLDALPAGPLRLLVLDAVQDPGNVGTLLRTAAAFGVAATIALPGTVDLWNAKVVRSAMGALFHRPTFSLTAEALAGFLAVRDVTLWGADADGAPVATLTPPARLALAVGNEGAGLTPPVRALAARLVSIPIDGDVESLNVAVAAGILLHRLCA